MTTKKSSQEIPESKRKIAVLMGFVMVLSLLFIAFEWSRKDVPYHTSDYSDFKGDVIYEMPQTSPEKSKPSPPSLRENPEKIEIKDKTLEKQVEKTEEKLHSTNVGEKINLRKIDTGNGCDDGDSIHVSFERAPQFKGDIEKYLVENLKYPFTAQEIGIQGRVVCKFVVNKDGSITDIEILRGVHKSLDDEAVRVIKLMPNWSPGIQNGKPVRVRFVIPVSFKLM